VGLFVNVPEKPAGKLIGEHDFKPELFKLYKHFKGVFEFTVV